jgi:hypothetical protein
MGINYNTLVSRSEEFLRQRWSQQGHPEVMAKPGDDGANEAILR